MDAVASLLEPVRSRWSLPIACALALGTLAMIEAGGAEHAHARQRVLERHNCIELARQSDVPIASMTKIELERRWLVGSFASPAEVDAALGTNVPAWQTFTYVFDAQPRQAIASDIYPSNIVPEYQFGRDEYGNIWLAGHARKARTRTPDQITYTRDIYLLPVGVSFRGVR